jgi:diguanylate cyclase (GGDEF) domain
MLEYYTVICLLNILVLALLCYMVQKNDILDQNKKTIYQVTILLTIVVIISELGTNFFDDLSSSFLIPNIVANTIGFSITPIIPLLLAFVFSAQHSRIKSLFFLPSVINLILSIISIKFALIFEVSTKNVYSRGPMFLVFILSYIWGIVILFFTVFSETRHYYNKNFILPFLALFVFIGTTFQVLIPKLHTAWICITFALVIYYAFICEFNDKHDILTSLFNRRMYENAKNHFEALEQAAIIVIDVNDFKQINDKYGHQYGDYCLSTLGIVIKEAFSKIGMSFRIGGDEFCILSDITDEKTIRDSLDTLINEIDSLRIKEPQFPSVSIGQKFYHKSNGYSINEVFQEADMEMYKYKEYNKTMRNT